MNILRPALTIGAYTLLEALRNRLGWLLLAAALAGLGLSGFAGQLALTESAELRAALLAASLRLAGVFLVATFVVTSMVREAHDQVLALLLALPFPRATYLIGKLLGFGMLAVLPALLFGALGLLYAPPAQVALWSLSFLCELWIVTSFSLLCSLNFRQVAPALAACAAFYLLARTVASLQLLGGHSGTLSLSQWGAQAGIDMVAALLPHLDSFTRTEWLVYHSGNLEALFALAGQTAIYVVLMSTAALFDLYRRSV